MSYFFLIIGGIIFIGCVFFGFITGIGKSFQKSPQESTIQTEKLKTKEKRMVMETEEKRRQMMEDMQQRIRDSQRH